MHNHTEEQKAYEDLCARLSERKTLIALQQNGVNILDQDFAANKPYLELIRKGLMNEWWSALDSAGSVKELRRKLAKSANGFGLQSGAEMSIADFK